MNNLRVTAKILKQTSAGRVLSRCYHGEKYDVAIIGGGIVGMATAQELTTRNSKLKCIVLEKEKELGQHQSGHNSGVIHAGMYYTPGSLRAKLCVEGLQLMYKYCEEHKIPHKRVGKLIVATQNSEVMSLQKLYDRAKQNGVPGVSLIIGDDIKQIEPYCEGVAALHSPNTGIVDYNLVTKTYGKVFQQNGGIIVNNYEVVDFHYDSSVIKEDITHPVQIHGKNKPPVSCRYVITCAGLYSDKLSLKTGCSSEPKIVPFRGDYLMLKPEKQHLVRGNIYPVPNPAFPFLGVHFTPRVDGAVWLGPNAILAFKREGYKLTDFSLKDTTDALLYRGLQKLLWKNLRFASQELIDGFFMNTMVKKLQRFIPQLTVDDVVRGPSGVRAQALDHNGNLVDDFVFDIGTGELGKHCLHVRNAPSPAATSSLAIAKMVADKFHEEFQL